MTVESRLKDRLSNVRSIPVGVRLHARNTLRLRLRAVRRRIHVLWRRIVLHIRSQKDFASRPMFVLVGLSFSCVARGYSMGTAAKMAPGGFPFSARAGTRRLRRAGADRLAVEQG